MRYLAFRLVVAWLVPAAACSSGGPGGPDGPAAAPVEDSTIALVRLEGWDTLTNSNAKPKVAWRNNHARFRTVEGWQVVEGDYNALAITYAPGKEPLEGELVYYPVGYDSTSVPLLPLLQLVPKYGWAPRIDTIPVRRRKPIFDSLDLRVEVLPSTERRLTMSAIVRLIAPASGLYGRSSRIEEWRGFNDPLLLVESRAWDVQRVDSARFRIHVDTVVAASRTWPIGSVNVVVTDDQGLQAIFGCNFDTGAAVCFELGGGTWDQ